MPEKSNLLDFAEFHGLAPNLVCRRGSPGACSVKSRSGKVDYPTKPDFELSEDRALICCTVPLRDLTCGDGVGVSVDQSACRLGSAK
ncbi:2Fe-2S iron-sulfur cluster-binding protein [uncultured Tateyamaria sp.]|uniref:2Fe-2S iron-sulfur cluster-binding protein n=1 Tax=uncultured Tateyamaria sp. TaxID=455651 RepID=UPI00344CE45A